MSSRAATADRPVPEAWEGMAEAAGRGDGDSTAEGIMHEADVTMYAAKGKGKHRVERSEPVPDRARAAGGANGWCEEPFVIRPA